MQDVKLTLLAHGCSILAKTSQGRNKILPKVFLLPPIVYGGLRTQANYA